ncbi:hypothetical protein [Cellulomonas cellasea]|nr:hypothetical protein [Cellulomonas cellasea]
MTTPTQQRTTPATGGTGRTGRRVARRLGALGAPTRLGTRAGAPPFDRRARGTWLDGRDVRLAGGVRRALGREPRDVARAAAAAGAWGAAPAGRVA